MGYIVGNIDCTVICEMPKLSPHTEQMRINIAEDCRVKIDAINVKATTTEKLGFTGRGEGIAAEAVCLIQKV
jgi:2-C-methyl-D-erythritol 2,4-cyclodiphosphate synthase